MKNSNELLTELSKLVKELDKKKIWAYMLEIATVIDGTESLSDEQKLDAYNLASTEFENYDDGTVGANVFAEAAIETILDERYPEFLKGVGYLNTHDLFIDKLSALLN